MLRWHMRFLDQILISQGRVYLLLFVAAFLEVWGDSYFSYALHRSSGVSRWASLIVGALILSLYGLAVNFSKWDFGTLLGVYVFFFYFSAQVVNWLRFKHPPGLPVYVGGFLMAAGAAVIKFWKI